MKVLLIIVAVLAFILLLKGKITIAYRDELTLTVSVLGIPFHILPAKEKKVHIWRFNLGRTRKKEAKHRLAAAKRAKADREKAAEKKQRKAEQKEAKKNQPKVPLDETIRMILSLVKTVFAHLGRYLHIEIARLRLVVATGDAAQTAILWGAVCPAVGALLEILGRITNLRTVRHCDIDVVPDFTAPTFTADVCISFSLRVWHLFAIAFATLFSFFKHKPAVPAKKATPTVPAKRKPQA